MTARVFFQKLFAVYPGEEKNAVIFAALGFLWSLGVSAGLKFADALFLLHVGAEHLPIVYTFTSCTMIILASALLYLHHYVPVNKIYLCSIGIGIVFYLFAFFCVLTLTGTESGWLWYLLRIFGSLFFTITLTCYWTFIDQYYPLQDAKRLYCLFSSVIFLGNATTGTVMRSGLVEIPVVTLSIAVLLSLSGILIYIISRSIHPVHDENVAEAQNAAQFEKHSLWKLLKTITRSRFTLLLMAGNFMTYVLLVLTEYNYMFSFEQYFDPGGTTSIVGDEEAAPLTQFLGQWLALVSIANIFFGLFLYSRIVRRYGIGSLLICTPLIWIVVFTGWSFSSTLLFPVLGIFIVEGTLYVIDDNNFNLLLNAIPSKIKNKTRVIIESFFEPVGMFVSSLLLAIPSLNSKHLGLFLSCALLIIIFLQRKQYSKAIYRNLAEHAVHFERSIGEWLTPISKKQLLGYANSADNSTLLFAANGIVSTGDEKLLSNFLKQISDERKKGWLLEHLFEASPIKTGSLVELLPLLDQPEKSHEAARKIALQASPDDLPVANLLVSRLRCFEDSELTLSCLTALGKMDSPTLARPIIESSIHFRPNERRLAETIILKMGAQIAPQLFDILKNTTIHDRCRTLSGRILSRLSLAELRGILFDTVSVEIDKAYFYFYHHHTVQALHPQVDLKLLTDGLLTGYHSAMDFIIQLLGAAGELEDPELLSRSLRSPHAKTRSQVVEALEKTCETKIFRLLQPLVMDIPEEEKIRGYQKDGRAPYSLHEIIDKLSYSPSTVDQIIVATLKQQLNFPHWKEGLCVHFADKDPLFQHFATELLDT